MKKLFSKIIQIVIYWPFRLLFFIFLDLKIKGTENIKKTNTSFILAVNHISYLDSIIVLSSIPFTFKYFPLRFMMWDFLYKILFFTRFVGAIPVRKGISLELSLSLFIKKLKNGERIVIFPEGSIKRKGRPIGARRGISYIASKTGKYIVPVKIDSNFRGWVSIFGGKFFDILRRKHKVKIIFGEPFKIEETIGKIPITDEELRKASEGVMIRIKKLK